MVVLLATENFSIVRGGAARKLTMRVKNVSKTAFSEYNSASLCTAVLMRLFINTLRPS